MPSDRTAIPPTAPREIDVVLRDGSTLHVRPVRSDDAQSLLAFFRSLSEQSRIFRFFGPPSEDVLTERARREATVDHDRSEGLLAAAGAGATERILAHASYHPMGDGHAEVAFEVADAYQGRGIATILLGRLAEIAAAHGTRIFEALVLPDNRKMIEVFRDAGFPVTIDFNGWELHVTFPTSLTEEALSRFERRDQIAASNALRPFLAPRSVAVIGASRRRGTIGGEIFNNVLSYGFAGPAYPINPAADDVQGVPAFRTVEDVPQPVDLAVIAVPAPEVAEVAEQCARKGVKALVVISAGFAEAGEEGRARQAKLIRICRDAGMRLIGPNCMGVINTDPAVRLNATFASQAPPAGRVGFLSQSGALGLATIEYAASLGLGLSTFISVGNKADISGNDLLNFWEDDTATDVILLYLESFGNPRRFARIARRLARGKPIVAVKSGRSAAGARAASSHTGALLAASDASVDALFRQAGVIRTNTLEELFDVATLLAHQPPPTGRRVAVLTNGGGPGILCADACEGEGLEVPVLSEGTQARLRAFLPAAATVRNPVDMIASATPDHYRETIRAVAADQNIDALIVIFVPPLVTQPDDVARALVQAAREVNGAKPILTVFMSSRGIPDALRTPDVRLPSFMFPESAAIALARAARYGEWRARPAGTPPQFAGLRREDAAAIVSTVLARGGGWASPEEAHALLSCYGLPVCAQRVAATPEEAGEAAAAVDGAVALKAIAAGILHKTEAGGVRLHLSGAAEVQAAAAHMAEALSAGGHSAAGFLVQPMAAEGSEMLVGLAHDPNFGPVLACGAGGTLVEVFNDVAVRLTPLTQRDASSMIRELRISRLLAGVRGRQARDQKALEDILLRTSAMAEDLPQIAEMDCNPVIVHEHGATIVDTRVRIAPCEPPPLPGTVSGRLEGRTP